MFHKAYLYVGLLINIAGSILQNTQHRPNCENGALVEDFFNVIFTEFRNIPPICVCVQMCSDQPTYCYPNGCFKTSSIRRAENPVSKIEDKAHGMFLVEQNKDLFELLESQKTIDHRSVMNERPLNEFTLRPNPFTELVFKQKRLPKLRMRYNLREQVKNTKTRKLKRDSVKLSNTRWPLNKQILHIKHPFSQFIDKRDCVKQQTNIDAMRQKPINYTPKYFEKYLTKRENGDVNVETLYLYKTDSANFSLEALIDNMIEGSLLENTNNVKLNMNNLDKLPETGKFPRNFTDFHLTSDRIDLEVISLNSSSHDTTYDASDNKNMTKMIETMSNEIDKQNKISIDISKKITGSRIDLNNIPITNDSFTDITTQVQERINRALPDKAYEKNVPLVQNWMKSKQLFARTLRKGKVH